MKPIENYGIKVLSIGFSPNRPSCYLRGPMAAKALNQMIFDAAWGELDFMLIDLPPGTGRHPLKHHAIPPITGAVVVSTPQAVALSDARKGVAMFRQESIQVPVLGIVENMAYFFLKNCPITSITSLEKKAKHLAEDLNVPFLAKFPSTGYPRRPATLDVLRHFQTATSVEMAFEGVTKKWWRKP